MLMQLPKPPGCDQGVALAIFSWRGRRSSNSRYSQSCQGLQRMADDRRQCHPNAVGIICTCKPDPLLRQVKWASRQWSDQDIDLALDTDLKIMYSSLHTATAAHRSVIHGNKKGERERYHPNLILTACIPPPFQARKHDNRTNTN